MPVQEPPPVILAPVHRRDSQRNLAGLTSAGDLGLEALDLQGVTQVIRGELCIGLKIQHLAVAVVRSGAPASGLNLTGTAGGAYGFAIVASPPRL